METVKYRFYCKYIVYFVAPIERNKWSAQNAQFLIVEYGLQTIIGRDPFDNLGICIKRQRTTNKIVSCINTTNSIKQQFAKNLPDYQYELVSKKIIPLDRNFIEITTYAIRKAGKFQSIYRTKPKRNWKNYWKKARLKKLIRAPIKASFQQL